MLTQEDLSGFCGMLITPAKEGADDILFEGNTVDLDESARVLEALIQAGVGRLSLMGTTGAGHSLTWEEKSSFIDTLVQVNRHRIPLFAGATMLGTRETAQNMRAFRDMGAEAAFVGLPLWQTPTIENSAQFFKDLSMAVPDLPIMIYANRNYFKSDFPLEFWQAVIAKGAQRNLITSKASFQREILEKCGKELYFMPGGGALNSYRTLKELGLPYRGYWSTRVNAGPEPLVALDDALKNDDEALAEQITADIAAVHSHSPADPVIKFNAMNVQAEALQAMYSDFMKPGPLRPPYTDVPEEWRDAGKAAGSQWAELRKKYIRAKV